MRIVIIPLIRQHALTNGGISFLGSAILQSKTSLVFFGLPGSGKTQMAIRGIEENARLIADNQIIISKDGCISPVFSQIELRYHTARRTRLWHQLSPGQRLRLKLFEMLYNMSLRYVSFNITPQPNDLGIEIVPDQRSNHHTVVMLTDCPSPIRSNFNNFADSIGAYYRVYWSLHGNILSHNTTVTDKRIRKCICDSMSKYSFWQFPIGTTFEGISETIVQ